MTQAETRLLEAFKARKAKAAQTPRIDNSSLYAGSPMYFYCCACGINHATLPESYTRPPQPRCDDCEFMFKQALIDSRGEILA